MHDSGGDGRESRPAGRLQRLDHALGCLLWKPLLLVLVLGAAGSAWAGLSAARDLRGGDRVLAVGLAIVVAVVFGAGALRVARKRGISEIEP